MSWTFKKISEELAKNPKLLKDCKQGIERETMRTTPEGDIAQTPHPHSLGSALANAQVNTDFSEAQVEIVTPPFNSEKSTLEYLDYLHAFVSRNLTKEFLWPFSMPPRLPKKESEIPIANYGTSNLAQKKTIYRRGLGHRYGRRMQTICGIHYNFSFSDKFWNHLYKKFAHQKESKQDFISSSYFRIMRNFLEISWLDTYLFGTASVFDKSYISKGHKAVKKLRRKTYHLPYGTSIRMSELGYSTSAQSVLNISYNNLGEYVSDLKKATAIPYRPYTKIGLEKNGEKIQLNDSVLQIPNEFYAPIRPKKSVSAARGEDLLQKMADEGVQYIEVRTVDIDPFEPLGINVSHMHFIQIMLVYCLMKENKSLSQNAQKKYSENHNLVALFGRKIGLKLWKDNKEIPLTEWGLEILNEMQTVAEILDYSEVLEDQIEKVENPNLTPSHKLIQMFREKKEQFIDVGLKIAHENQKYFKTKKLPPKVNKNLEQLVKDSIFEQEKMEIRDRQVLQGYEDLERSTQIIIREAFRRGIKVEVLDRKENFIKLSKGKKIEYLKQATKTSKDSYMTFLIMENKLVTKEVLETKGIRVPRGKIYYSPEQADYKDFEKIKCVIKPTTANFGIGINFARPGDEKSFKEGIKEAFKHSESVIVEEFISGNEYRFLVINDKVIGIINRVPANVIGDGIHNVRQLVKLKNEDPRLVKTTKEYIHTGKIETAKLAEQKLTWSSIPKKGQKVFLRENSNISTGGDSVDVTDEILEDYSKIAIESTKAVEAKICGVDMMIENPKQKPTDKNYAIIELNFNPVLKMHQFPTFGKGRDTAGPVLELLGF